MGERCAPEDVCHGGADWVWCAWLEILLGARGNGRSECVFFFLRGRTLLLYGTFDLFWLGYRGFESRPIDALARYRHVFLFASLRRFVKVVATCMWSLLEAVFCFCLEGIKVTHLPDCRRYHIKAPSPHRIERPVYVKATTEMPGALGDCILGKQGGVESPSDNMCCISLRHGLVVKYRASSCG